MGKFLLSADPAGRRIAGESVFQISRTVADHFRIGVLIFSAYSCMTSAGSCMAANNYVMATLGLFLSIYNLFISLLNC